MVDDLKRVIHRHALRATPVRLAVLRLMRDTERPLSHGEVIAKLGTAGRDRATVYRSLQHFERVGLIRRVDLGDRVWRFAARDERDGTSTTTFECTSCGKLLALDGVALRGPRTAPRAVRKGQISILLRGTCDECA